MPQSLGAAENAAAGAVDKIRPSARNRRYPDCRCETCKRFCQTFFEFDRGVDERRAER